ncbi:hypothetical protein GSI_03978 [Ganoderma sinense ZZ0214-1]|uniref:Uncharacterized protein n=1 Tax=Ganoderma sinense ZZ0214-1 TaxID=1077348 RepID=A0A2G8SKJ2_9APHY|nr:hypothetical protein GSI_03978 [Ganoderma sinense ZZ0214-1]
MSAFDPKHIVAIAKRLHSNNEEEQEKFEKQWLKNVEARWKGWQKHRDGSEQIAYVPQLEFIAHVVEYVNWVYGMTKTKHGRKPLPRDIPLYGPAFIPPSYMHEQLRNGMKTTVAPETAYLKAVTVIHPLYFPQLEKCPRCGTRKPSDLDWYGWVPTGHCEVHGVDREETALGYQLRCQSCKTRAKGQQATRKNGEGSYCFSTTNHTFWSKYEHWQIPAGIPIFLKRRALTRSLFDLIVELRVGSTSAGLEENFKQLHLLRYHSDKKAYLDRYQELTGPRSPQCPSVIQNPTPDLLHSNKRGRTYRAAGKAKVVDGSKKQEKRWRGGLLDAVNQNGETVAWRFCQTNSASETSEMCEGLKKRTKMLKQPDPVVVVSDNCCKVANAITTHFPDAHIALDVWHVLRRYMGCVLGGRGNGSRTEIANDITGAVLKTRADKYNPAVYWSSAEQEVRLEGVYNKWAKEGALDDSRHIHVKHDDEDNNLLELTKPLDEHTYQVLASIDIGPRPLPPLSAASDPQPSPTSLSQPLSASLPQSPFVSLPPSQPQTHNLSPTPSRTTTGAVYNASICDFFQPRDTVPAADARVTGGADAFASLSLVSQVPSSIAAPPTTLNFSAFYQTLKLPPVYITGKTRSQRIFSIKTGVDPLSTKIETDDEHDLFMKLREKCQWVSHDMNPRKYVEAASVYNIELEKQNRLNAYISYAVRKTPRAIMDKLANVEDQVIKRLISNDFTSKSSESTAYWKRHCFAVRLLVDKTNEQIKRKPNTCNRCKSIMWPGGKGKSNNHKLTFCSDGIRMSPEFTEKRPDGTTATRFEALPPWPQPSGIFVKGSVFMPHAFLHTARQFYLNMITLGSGGGHNAMEYLAFAEMLHSRTITVPADDSESTTSESAGPHPDPTHPAPAHTAVDSNPASSTARTTVDSNPASSATVPPSGIPLQALVDSCAIAKAASGFGGACSDTDNVKMLFRLFDTFELGPCRKGLIEVREGVRYLRITPFQDGNRPVEEEEGESESEADGAGGSV